MKAYLISYELYNDPHSIKRYKLVYADSEEEALFKLDNAIYVEYTNPQIETIL